MYTVQRSRKRKTIEAIKAEVEENIAKVEKEMNAGFGDKDNPLLLSVRSGARASMPGMMDTVLNLGLNVQTLEGLIQNQATSASYGTHTAGLFRCMAMW